MVLLLKHHVIRCMHCGQLQMSSADERAKCLACRRTWKILMKGMTRGVLASYYLPQEAGAHVRALKEREAMARMESERRLREALGRMASSPMAAQQ